MVLKRRGGRRSEQEAVASSGRWSRGSWPAGSELWGSFASGCGAGGLGPQGAERRCCAGALSGAVLREANPGRSVSTLAARAAELPVNGVQGPRRGSWDGTWHHPRRFRGHREAGGRGCGRLCADSLRRGGGRGGAGAEPHLSFQRRAPRSGDESQARVLGFPQVRPPRSGHAGRSAGPGRGLPPSVRPSGRRAGAGRPHVRREPPARRAAPPGLAAHR